MKNGLIIDQDGTKRYFLNGKLHRLDGPAVEHPRGSKEWYFEGELHRENGPAFVCFNGYASWKEYWVNGKRHRADGPAVEFKDGFKRWCYQGEEFNCKTQKEFEQLIKLRAFR
jgi:hypothetical protein